MDDYEKVLKDKIVSDIANVSDEETLDKMLTILSQIRKVGISNS